jgi:hypothetical protein
MGFILLFDDVILVLVQEQMPQDEKARGKKSG